MRQFSCSTVKARKVETAKFDFSGVICTNDSRRRRNVASFSGGPGLEFMPRGRLSFCPIFGAFPQSFRHAEVLLHAAHWPVLATCHTTHSHSSTLYNTNIWESVVQWTKVWVLFSIDYFLTRRERIKFKPEQNMKCRHKQIWVISDFRRGVNDIFALLGWQLPTFRNNVSVLSSISPRRILGCFETSVIKYQYTLRNNPQERRSYKQVLKACFV